MRKMPLALSTLGLVGALLIICWARENQAEDNATVAQTATEETAAQRRERLRAISRQKRDIRAYLKKQTGVDPPKPAVPAGKPAKHFECMKQYLAAKGDRKKIYALIAHHLRLAEALLEQQDVEVKRSGLGVARHAAFAAALDLKDDELTTAICDAWFVPNIDFGDDIQQKYLSKHNMLIASVSLYRHAEAHEKMIAQAQKWMEASADNRNAADCARMRIGQALDALGRHEEAIAILDEITDSGMRGAKDLIPAIRAKLEQQKAKASAKSSTETKK